jgi:thiosulfate dehydrogenase [quinone] large subunit
MTKRQHYLFTDPPVAQFVFGSTKMAVVWLIVRLYVGWTWLEAGWGKIHADAWVGESAGAALTGFIRGALAKTAGPHPDVQGWYAWFLQHAVLPHAATWGHVVAWGEFLVGIGLILGVLTGIAAFFGAFMNLNFLMAGTVSVNPVLGVLSLALVLAWKVAGYYGGDRWLLPVLGTPWRPGRAFHPSRM